MFIKDNKIVIFRRKILGLQYMLLLLRFYIIIRFFKSKKRDFLRFFALLRTFSRTMPTDNPPTDLSFQKIQMAISLRWIIQFTPCLVLGWGFQGWRIEWHYLQFDQIQDGGSVAILENSYGNISTMHHLIHSVFGSRMGYSGSAERRALFRVGPNSIGMWLKIMREE